MTYNSFGMLISTLNRESVLQDHKDCFKMYYDQAKKYFPIRHKNADFKWLARNAVIQARHYRHMVEQCQYVFEAFGELEEFING